MARMGTYNSYLVDVDPNTISDGVDRGKDDSQFTSGGLLIIDSHILYIIHEGLYTNRP